MRYIVAILGLLLLVGGLAGIKATQISGLIKAGEAFAKAGPPPETVSTEVAKVLNWEGTITAIGSVAAARGVAVSNDAAGVVKRIMFDSGALAKPGQVLVELDTSVERAQLATAEARKELAQQTVDRTRQLYKSGGVSKSALDNDESQLKAAQAEVEGLKAQIDRKLVRAAFAGRLGIREVNLGQYLNSGTRLTTLEALDSVYVDFTLPQQALSSLQVGSSIRLHIDATEGQAAFGADGKIAAIDPSLDRSTRAIRVRASVPNADQKLRPGMFATVSVVLPKQADVVAVPSTAVVHAPYGDSIFIVENTPDEKGAKDSTPQEAKPQNVRRVRQQFVRLGEERGDFVAILEGVSAGQEVVSAGAFKLRNGASITVNNGIKPDYSVQPKVENR